MELGDILAFKHIEVNMSGTQEWHKVEIIGVQDKNVVVGIVANMKNFNISDEVRCRIFEGKNHYTFGGEIFDVNFCYPQSVVIFVHGKIKRMGDFRREKRFSTNYLGEVYKLKSCFGCVRDLSTKGILFNTNDFLEIGDLVGVRIFHEGNIEDFIFFEGIVVRKGTSETCFMYGIEIDAIMGEYEDKFLDLIEKLGTGMEASAAGKGV